jgi:hypothetical protein
VIGSSGWAEERARRLRLILDRLFWGFVAALALALLIFAVTLHYTFPVSRLP